MLKKISIAQTEKLSTKAILFFMFTIAVVLRIASCSKYLFVDESLIFSNIDNFFRKHTFIPLYPGYPTLFSYLSTIPTSIGATILYLQGTLPSIKEISILLHLDSIFPILPSRFTSMVFGLSTILLLFVIGKEFFDKKTGLIAAAFLTFSNLHINYSSYALPDVTMTFFSTCSLLFSLYALKTKSIKDFILGGIFAGLTASTKYNGALIVLPIIAVHFIHLYDEKRFLPPKFWINRRIVFSALAFICAFIIGSPSWLFDTGSLWNALRFLRGHIMITGYLGSFGVPYLHHLMLFWHWEKTIAIFFGLGLLYAIFRRSRQDIVLLSLVLPSFLFIGSWQSKLLHYLLFLYPAMALLSARLLSEIFSKLKKQIVNIGAFLILISVFGLPLYSSSKYAYEQILEDSRWIAYRWIQNNIPERNKVVVDWAYLPILLTEEQKSRMENDSSKDFYISHLKNIRTHELIPLEYSPFWLAEVQADYLITSSGCFDRFFNSPPPPSNNPHFNGYNNRKNTYNALFYNEKEVGWKLLKEFYTGKGHRVLVYQRERKMN